MQINKIPCAFVSASQYALKDLVGRQHNNEMLAYYLMGPKMFFYCRHYFLSQNPIIYTPQYKLTQVTSARIAVAELKIMHVVHCSSAFSTIAAADCPGCTHFSARLTRSTSVRCTECTGCREWRIENVLRSVIAHSSQYALTFPVEASDLSVLRTSLH